MSGVTDADRAKAAGLLGWNLDEIDGVGDSNDLATIDAIAAALAAERAAAVAGLRTRVEAVAEELRREGKADAVPGKSTRDQVRAGALLTAAARLRAAVTDTTGGTQ